MNVTRGCTRLLGVKHGIWTRRGERRPAAGWARVCYAVDDASDPPLIVKAERRGGRVIFETLPGNAAWPPPAGGRDRVVAACLRSGESFLRRIQAPFPSPAKARKVFPTLLDIELPFPLEECACAFLAPRAEGPVTEALAAGARLSAVRARLDALRARAMDPLILDQEGLALWTQSLRERPPDAAAADAPRVVVSLGADRATLALGRGDKLFSAHAVRSDDHAHMARVLAGVFRDKPDVTLWFWCGAGAGDGRRPEALRARLAADWPGPSATHDAPAAFLARALATRALLPGPLRCNLRAGPLAHPALLARAAALSARAAALFLAGGLLLHAANIGWNSAVRRREARLDAAFAALRDALSGYRVEGAKGAYALRIVKERLDERLAAMAPFRRAFEPSLLRAMGAILAVGARHDLQYEALTIEADRLAVSGTAGDWNKCEELAAALSALGYAVRLDRGAALDNARIPFAAASEGAP